jgi:hypothetical protein
MYLHVKKVGEIDDLEQADPFALVAAGKVVLTHSECVGGAMSVEDAGDAVTLVCGKCQARQDLERQEAADALLRVLVHEEYAWAGDAGLLPD